MRKSFVLLLALVLLVSGTAYYAQNELLQEKDQVHYEEKVLYGDKSVVDGVTVEMDVCYDYNLFWNTVYEIGDKPKEETDYSFYAWDNNEHDYDYAGSIDFVIDCTDSVGFDYGQDKEYYGLDAAVKELYDKTALGSESSATVYLKDYVDYYTFGLDVELPYKNDGKHGTYYRYSYLWESELRADIAELEETGRDNENLVLLKKYLADMEAFQAFFKIPVLDTEVYSIAMAKDVNGELSGLGISHQQGGSGTGDIDIPETPKVPGADAFDFRLFTAFDEGDCYMTFDPHTHNNNLVDMSLIPGGYGIYHFTYDVKKGTLNVEDLKLVYELDPNTQWDSMTMDASGENLLLFTYDEKNYYMSVIDCETMMLVDKFTLGDKEAYFTYWIYEDYLIVNSDKLVVLPLDENGRYYEAWSVDLEKLEIQESMNARNRDIFEWDSCFDWNGEILLIANNIMTYDENGFLVGNGNCDFYVAAINETGLLYYGEYESSLKTTDTNYEPCRKDREKKCPIRIRWN